MTPASHDDGRDALVTCGVQRKETTGVRNPGRYASLAPLLLQCITRPRDRSTADSICVVRGASVRSPLERRAEASATSCHSDGVRDEEPLSVGVGGQGISPCVRNDMRGPSSDHVIPRLRAEESLSPPAIAPPRQTPRTAPGTAPLPRRLCAAPDATAPPPETGARPFQSPR